MMLSYSFVTGMTSGYVKAVEELNFRKVLDDLVLCGRPVSHPLLLPVLTLCYELSSNYDLQQRALRTELEKLDAILAGRHGATSYSPRGGSVIDFISNAVNVCRTGVLQTRPQAWQNVVDNVRHAAAYTWDHVPAEKKSSELRDLHVALMNRLDFLDTKLQGIENYAHVTLERLGVLRDEVRNPGDLVTECTSFQFNVQTFIDT